MLNELSDVVVSSAAAETDRRAVVNAGLRPSEVVNVDVAVQVHVHGLRPGDVDRLRRMR